MCCAHMQGEESGCNKVNVKNEQFGAVDYSDKDSGGEYDSDSSDSDDPKSPPVNLKNHQEE